jgi:GAF domain-containing protein
MRGDEAAPPPGDLLPQAVEGMERPLLVLDAGWYFSYINPAGARVLDRTVEELLGRNVWAVLPEAVGGPFEELCTQVRRTGESGSAEAWFAPLRKWFHADAFLTDAGLVITYDDVTARRRVEEERAAAIAAREAAATEAARAANEAETAGRHLMLLGDISQAMTSTLDMDAAVDRFAHLVVPLLADGCLVSAVGADGRRRDVGRAHSDPSMVAAMHRYADLRVAGNAATAPVPTALRSGRPVVIPELTPADIEEMVRDAETREALLPLRPSAVATFPLSARGELFGAFTLVNGPERGPHTSRELRTAEIASRRAALALDNARLATANQ